MATVSAIETGEGSSVDYVAIEAAIESGERSPSASAAVISWMTVEITECDSVPGVVCTSVTIRF